MNNEDMSDFIQKLSSMINTSNNTNSIDNDNNQDMSSNFNETSYENLQAILSNMNSNSYENGNNNENTYNSNFNFDFETIMKMKNIMDKINSTKNSPEANLLLSLKPYLNNNRKQKLDQYMQFLNITKVLEAFNSSGGVNNNDISQ